MVIIAEHKAAHGPPDRADGISDEFEEILHGVGFSPDSLILHPVDDEASSHLFIYPFKPSALGLPVNQIRTFIIPHEQMQYIKALQRHPHRLHMTDMRRIKGTRKDSDSSDMCTHLFTPFPHRQNCTSYDNGPH